RNIGPRLIVRWSHGRSSTTAERSEYPTRDANAAGGAAAGALVVRGSVPFPALPRTRTRLRGRLAAGHSVRGGAPASRRADGRDRPPDEPPPAAGLPDPARSAPCDPG